MAGFVKNIPAYVYSRNPQNRNILKNWQVAITMYCNQTLFDYLNTKIDTEAPSGGSDATIRLQTWSDINPPSNYFALFNIAFGDMVFSKAMTMYYGIRDDNMDVNSEVGMLLNKVGVNYRSWDPPYYTPTSDPTSNLKVNELWGLNTHIYTNDTYLGHVQNSGKRVEILSIINYHNYRFLCSINTHPGTGESYTNYFDIYQQIFPENIFGDNIDTVCNAYENDNKFPINIHIHGSFAQNTGKFSGTLDVSKPRSSSSSANGFYWVKETMGGTHQYNDNPQTGESNLEPDDTNPYGLPGVSGPGGGDGTYPDIDLTEPVPIPDLPEVSANDIGFITMYNPTISQLQQLSAFMWSNVFDLATYKKLFSDPMQSIIGLALVPVAPDISGARSVHFGTIDSEVDMPTIGNQYKQLDCGWVDIEKYVGSFMDYAPYTKISIYLPYIGFRTLSADDIMPGSLHVVYNIDLLTGACAAFIEHSYKGVLYAYNGSCITNIPLTAQNFSGAIQNAVTAIISAGGVVAGMATGAAPITAMGAAGLLSSAANTALNSKPDIQRSGNLGGSAGILSVQTPYLIIERPNISVPDNVQHYVGQCSNITAKLDNLSGFTIVDYIHLHNVEGTSEELAEIESLLKTGVIL